MTQAQKETLFAMYFSSIAGIQFHPANQENPKRYTLEQCASLALQMLEIHENIFKEN